MFFRSQFWSRLGLETRSLVFLRLQRFVYILGTYCLFVAFADLQLWLMGT